MLQTSVLPNVYHDDDDNDNESNSDADIDDSKRFVSAHSQHSELQKMKCIEASKPVLMIADTHNPSPHHSSL